MVQKTKWRHGFGSPSVTWGSLFCFFFAWFSQNNIHFLNKESDVNRTQPDFYAPTSLKVAFPAVRNWSLRINFLLLRLKMCFQWCKGEGEQCGENKRQCMHNELHRLYTSSDTYRSALPQESHQYQTGLPVEIRYHFFLPDMILNFCWLI